MKRILVVDDDVNYSNSLKNILNMKNFEVDVIANPFVVEKYLENNRPDCILLDFKMPGLNGIELLQRIKKRLPEIPIIVISAVELKYMKVNPLQVGASTYIEKPFELNELLEAILSVTQQKLNH
ncbi:response regulator [Calditrichota bacterium LG25]